METLEFLIYEAYFCLPFYFVHFYNFFSVHSMLSVIVHGYFSVTRMIFPSSSSKDLNIPLITGSHNFVYRAPLDVWLYLKSLHFNGIYIRHFILLKRNGAYLKLLAFFRSSTRLRMQLYIESTGRINPNGQNLTDNP